RRTPQWGVTAPPVFMAITAAAGGDWVQVDAGAAIVQLQLAAYALGLGCCWIGAFDHAAADRILQLSAGMRTVYLVAVGYPAESPVRDDIGGDGEVGYYLDAADILHVPKYTVDAITDWR
ncbi:MAG: nitroreductase family protein, partial [Victivallales bacterium]|nr:nitroreductase family protein [Victivallales bacterium]